MKPPAVPDHSERFIAFLQGRSKEAGGTPLGALGKKRGWHALAARA
jgi:hypothetical protein